MRRLDEELRVRIELAESKRREREKLKEEVERKAKAMLEWALKDHEWNPESCEIKTRWMWATDTGEWHVLLEIWPKGFRPVHPANVPTIEIRVVPATDAMWMNDGDFAKAIKYALDPYCWVKA